MRIALVNPTWSFQGSVYFGCREPHLPLEYGYARALLAGAGHDVRIIDGQARGLSLGAIRAEVSVFGGRNRRFRQRSGASRAPRG